MYAGMRLAFKISIVLALTGCSPKDSPTLAEMLTTEDSGELDDATLPDSEQFEEVQARYIYYLESVNTAADKDAARAACKRSMERILERARQRVKDAEEQSKRAKDKAAPSENA
jgi:hypothetical protein